MTMLPDEQKKARQEGASLLDEEARKALYESSVEAWRELWPSALSYWSIYSQLQEPIWIFSDEEAKQYDMRGSLAAIRYKDQRVFLNFAALEAAGLLDFAPEFLAHEVGHHVYVPGNNTSHARMFSMMQECLFGLPEQNASLLCNLYADLLINDRLQRSGFRIADIYQKLQEPKRTEPQSKVWVLYLRTYEYLWKLRRGSLVMQPIVLRQVDADALLLARMIRHFSAEWLLGARRFAMVVYPYLLEDLQKNQKQTFVLKGLDDTSKANQDDSGGASIPDGLVEISPEEQQQDDGFDGPAQSPQEHETKKQHSEGGQKQYREPISYRKLLKSLGLHVDHQKVTARYYRDRALPHLLPFPSHYAYRVREPLPEGYELWEPSSPIESLDLFGTALQSPVVIPGVTTVQRVYGSARGHDPALTPVDLDIYVDCSGSMPDPSEKTSYLALAASILVLSALRVGARVQATLWSGPRQFETSGGFLQDEQRLLSIVTGYIAGSTAFPLHVLRDTFAERSAVSNPAHIVVISDEGVDTMLSSDEKGNNGAQICRMALERARGGGSLVLNLASESWKPREQFEKLGFHVHTVTDWEELLVFARAFVRKNYTLEVPR